MTAIHDRHHRPSNTVNELINTGLLNHLHLLYDGATSPRPPDSVLTTTGGASTAPPTSKHVVKETRSLPTTAPYHSSSQSPLLVDVANHKLLDVTTFQATFLGYINH